MEQFLWQELFAEYNRQASAQVDLGEDRTEYYDQFCKDVPPKNEETEEVLVNKYPLYCTTAVTVWNHEGDFTKTFKRKYSITRPIDLCLISLHFRCGNCMRVVPTEYYLILIFHCKCYIKIKLAV